MLSVLLETGKENSANDRKIEKRFWVRAIVLFSDLRL